MSPLTETDLSNVSNPLSLSINPEQRIKINNIPNEWDDSDGFNQSSQTSSGLRLHFDITLFEDIDETPKRYATNNPFSSLTLLWSNNNVSNDIHIFLIDPITGKNYTALFSDDATFKTYQTFTINQIIWRNYITIMNAETVSAEDTNETNSNIKAIGTPSITHANNDIISSDSPYRYNIMSGDILMRDTYINNWNMTIQAGSWTDIKTH
jgi:hypothetical protein